MSRAGQSRMRFASGFPRVSGDEPQVATDFKLDFEFSPRERG